MEHTKLILDLYENDMIKFGKFTLKSGKESYIYADIRTTISHPKIFQYICSCIYQSIKNLKYDFICGVPYSALTFASAISYAHNIPMLLKRKEVKEYGTKKILEGAYTEGQSCLLIEDVITTGASLLETITVLQEHGLKIIDICSLIERNQGGSEYLEALGYKVHSIITLIEIVNVLYEAKRITLDDKNMALSCIKK